MNFDVNYLAILTSAVSFMIIGFLWYGPLFGKPWMKLVGMSPGSMTGEQRKSMSTAMLGMFICALISSFVLAALLKSLLITTIGNALVLAILVWLAFVATTMLNRVVFERSPLKLYVINSTQYLVAYIVAVLILVSWPW